MPTSSDIALAALPDIPLIPRPPLTFQPLAHDRFIFMVLAIVGKYPRSVDDMKAQGMYVEYCVRVRITVGQWSYVVE